MVATQTSEGASFVCVCAKCFLLHISISKSYPLKLKTLSKAFSKLTLYFSRLKLENKRHV